jgi:polyhydroxyalkanoate synthase subunit PhaC
MPTATHTDPDRLTELPVTTLNGSERVGQRISATHCVTCEDVDMRGEPVDRMINAELGRLTTGLSPLALAKAWMDWGLNLAVAPARQADLVARAVTLLSEAHIRTLKAADDITLQNSDAAARLWAQPPYSYLESLHLAQMQWWEEAIASVRGVERQHKNLAAFSIRQLLSALSPANFLWTNPEVMHRTMTENGANLLRGMHNALDDRSRALRGAVSEQAEAFVIGEKVAVTPGKVVFRNYLFELIQYSPTTATVHPQPVLIAPAWIMKYFILDLSPENSLVRYLVGQGFTVFMMSWKNPDASYRSIGFNHYVMDGFLEALRAVNAIVPGQQVHATGYCIGGTMLSIAAAYLATQQDDRLCSVTLFATQNDFEEAGELLYFVDESQLTYLEDVMWQQGYLDGDQMSVAFSMLRPKELVWAKIVQDYLLGERKPIIDLIAWNENNTHLPYRMHSEYLRRFFLQNDLAEGRYDVNGVPISLTDIDVPVFAVATEKDHIAPWKSVYKVHLYADTDVTFVLTTKGHNAGIVSEPGRKGREYRIHTRQARQPYLHPARWEREAVRHDGSWWPAWTAWLAARSDGERVAPPAMGNAAGGFAVIGDAPGAYVRER